jgi:hypothetical protein
MTLLFTMKGMGKYIQTKYNHQSTTILSLSLFSLSLSLSLSLAQAYLPVAGRIGWRAPGQWATSSKFSSSSSQPTSQHNHETPRSLLAPTLKQEEEEEKQQNAACGNRQRRYAHSLWKGLPGGRNKQWL